MSNYDRLEFYRDDGPPGIVKGGAALMAFTGIINMCLPFSIWAQFAGDMPSNWKWFQTCTWFLAFFCLVFAAASFKKLKGKAIKLVSIFLILCVGGYGAFLTMDYLPFDFSEDCHYWYPLIDANASRCM